MNNISDTVLLMLKYARKRRSLAIKEARYYANKYGGISMLNIVK